jgi:sterol O-acyltransferase
MSQSSAHAELIEPSTRQMLRQSGNGNAVGRKPGSKFWPADAVDDSDSSDEIEDYDDLQLDPETLIANTRRSMDESYGRPSSRQNKVSEGTTEPAENATNTERRTSIQVRLEKTDRKGRYILTADDPETKDILRKGIERQNEDAGVKKPRVRFRDLVFTRQFTTFDRQNPSASESPFFGFFTLFWIAMVLMFVRVSMHNYRDYGNILGSNQIMKMMFSHDIFILGLTDGVMCASTAQGLLFQRLVHKGWLRWERGGWIVQNIWQSMYLAAVIGWTYFRDWPWTHTTFIVLHGLVFLMKQHSYAFYNGYLSGVYRRRALLERKLKQLEHMEPIASPPASPSSTRQNGDYSSGLDLHRLSSQTAETLLKRRPSTGPRTSTDFQREESDVAEIAKLIESGHTIDTQQMSAFENIIKAEIDDLTRELKGKSMDGKNAYPRNLTVSNFFDWICLPTLVYELEYPRQERINWWYVLEKTTATFGVLCVMMVISQAFIYPPVAKTVQMKEAGMPIEQRWQEFPFIVSDMLFPLLIEQLLTWYLIWECILNVLAELTKFADRGFYGDWWNSVTWDQYARDWNRPVHNFLLRHVYHSSISTFRLSRTAATFVTFLLSALVHEMMMAIIFKKVRGYLFWMQLLQMPLVTMSRSKLMKERVVLGNIIFWIGLFVGPSFLTSLYLVI